MSDDPLSPASEAMLAAASFAVPVRSVARGAEDSSAAAAAVAASAGSVEVELLEEEEDSEVDADADAVAIAEVLDADEQEARPLRESSFTPVLSKSAKRRAQRKLNEQLRAEAHARFSPFRTPPPPQAAAAAVSAPPSAWHSATPPLRFAPPPPRSAGGGLNVRNNNVQFSPSPLPALREMFPALDADVLESIFISCGRSFETVVAQLLTHDDAQTRDDRQMQAALSASLAAAALEGIPVDPLSADLLAAPRGVDRLSPLSADLFQLLCEHLNSFELARLASVSRDARTQVDAGAFAHVEKVDLSRFASWPDWRMLRMVARFPSSHCVSFRNTEFKSFTQLAATCFGRHIRMLSFSGCPRLQDVHLHELFDLGEHLDTLDLSACENLTDDGLEYLATARHNRALRKLVLSECKYISSTGVCRVLERCTGLQQLDLKGTNVTRAILSFTQQQSQLTALNLSACKKLPADLSITSPFCVLRTLNLSSNPALKSVTLAVPTLTSLNCSNSKHIHTLALYTPQLRVLQLNGCLLLSQVGTIPHHNKQLVTHLEEANFNLCRSLTALSFQYLLASARTTLRLLSCRGCLLLSDANIALLLPPERPASQGYSLLPEADAAAASSRAPVAPAACPLEWLDLSGCKSASPSHVLLATRSVADANARREAEASQKQQREAAASSWARHFGMGGSSGSDEEPSGGLDDDELEPLDA